MKDQYEYGRRSKLLVEELSDQEIAIFEECIYPNKAQILEEAFELRALIDHIILNPNSRKEGYLDKDLDEIKDLIKPSLKRYGSELYEQYPIGKCGEIRSLFMMLWLKGPVMYESQQMIRNYRQRGGKLKSIWGEVRAKYFQNAIQLGPWCFDPANNTVDEQLPTVKITHLFEDPEFRNIDSLETYSKIKATYHQHIAFPNVYFPNLMPCFPLIYLCKETGCFQFDNSHYCLDLIIDTEGATVVDYFHAHPERMDASTVEQFYQILNSIQGNTAFSYQPFHSWCPNPDQVISFQGLVKEASLLYQQVCLANHILGHHPLLQEGVFSH